MSDLAARIKDLTERIGSIKGELSDSTTRSRFSVTDPSVTDPSDVFFGSRAEREKRLGELERELADLQGQVPATSADMSLDYPAIPVPGANATVSGTYQLDHPGADVPDLAEPTSFTAQPASSPPPPAERPRTQEKPGTGAKDRNPEPPQTQRTGPTGQITDETGTYGPEQTWRPGTRDWNTVNRFGGTAKQVPKVVYALGIVALLALLIGTMLRPPSVSEPSGSIVQSGGAATPAPTTTVPTAAPATATPAPGPTAPTAASAGYRCVGGQKTLFDNSNGSVVTSGGTPPTFSTNGKTYCLMSVSTYHWNGGQGATPGRIGLIGSSGNVGPVQTKSGTGVPNADWVYVPEADARPLLSGQYTCTDSDPASWSQNEASGRLGFCRVFVQDAVKP